MFIIRAFVQRHRRPRPFGATSGHDPLARSDHYNHCPNPRDRARTPGAYRVRSCNMPSVFGTSWNPGRSSWGPRSDQGGHFRECTPRVPCPQEILSRTRQASNPQAIIRWHNDRKFLTLLFARESQYNAAGRRTTQRKSRVGNRPKSWRDAAARAGTVAAFTSLFLVKKGLEDVGRLFNSVCEKGLGKLLETQDCYALDLFAPKTIHERRNCSKFATNSSVVNIAGFRCQKVFKWVQFMTESLSSDHSVVEHDVEQRTVNFQPTVIVNKPQLSEPIHKEVNPRPGRADHFRQSLLANFRDYTLRSSFLSKMSQTTRIRANRFSAELNS
jgi:hypothetical protein